MIKYKILITRFQSIMNWIYEEESKLVKKFVILSIKSVKLRISIVIYKNKFKKYKK